MPKYRRRRFSATFRTFTPPHAFLKFRIVLRKLGKHDRYYFTGRLIADENEDL